MPPSLDFDAILLLAMSLAAKRRPAELVEIVAAIDLIQGDIPVARELFDAFHRLAQYGLIRAQDESCTLTPYALNVLSGQKKKASHEERILAIKPSLAECRVKHADALPQLTLELIAEAARAHRASINGAIKNLVSKPKPPAGTDQRPARRKSNQAFAVRQRKK